MRQFLLNFLLINANGLYGSIFKTFSSPPQWELPTLLRQLRYWLTHRTRLTTDWSSRQWAGVVGMALLVTSTRRKSYKFSHFFSSYPMVLLFFSASLPRTDPVIGALYRMWQFGVHHKDFLSHATLPFSMCHLSICSLPHSLIVQTDTMLDWIRMVYEMAQGMVSTGTHTLCMLHTAAS